MFNRIKHGNIVQHVQFKLDLRASGKLLFDMSCLHFCRNNLTLHCKDRQELDRLLH